MVCLLQRQRVRKDCCYLWLLSTNKKAWLYGIHYLEQLGSSSSFVCNIHYTTLVLGILPLCALHYKVPCLVSAYISLATGCIICHYSSGVYFLSLKNQPCTNVQMLNTSLWTSPLKIVCLKTAHSCNWSEGFSFHWQTSKE